MLSQTFIPSPAVRHLARNYHIRHFIFKGGTTSFKPYQPRPEQSIVFYPRQPEVVEFTTEDRKLERPQAMIMNQYTVPTNRHVANDFLVIIVELYPGILHRLLGMPLDRLTNIDMDAEAVMCTEISHVSERLKSTTDYGAMITMIEALMVHLAARLKSQEHAVDKVAGYLLGNGYNCSIDWLASQASLSPRQLERKFKERIGVGPKTFARLTRMHETYKAKSVAPHLDWLDISLLYGYHDYQHMAKDYIEFAGCSPRELFQKQEQAPERMFGLTETFNR